MRGFDWLRWMTACSVAALLAVGCDGGEGEEDAGTDTTDSGPVCRMAPDLTEGTRPPPRT